MHRLARLATLLGLCLIAATAWPQPAKKHFMWRVTDAKGSALYLLGSLHVLTPEFYPLSAEIEKAFELSTVLVEEVDLEEMNNPAALLPMMGKAMFTDGRTLDQVVSAATYADVTRRAEKAHLPILAVQRMKPWMAAVALTVPILQAAGFDPNLGVDKHFFDKAKAAGLERRGLETVAYQLDRFDQLSPALQEAMLTSTLAELDTQVANVKEVAAAWASGDTATLEREMLASMRESPELYDRLLVERNQNWVSHIDACLLQDAKCFVVVGAAHLVGPHGLPALLAKKGYDVRQQ